MGFSLFRCKFNETKSLEKVMTYKEDFKLLPGHGQETTLKEEQVHLPSWLRYF